MRTTLAVFFALAILVPAWAIAADPYADVNAMRIAFARVHSATATERFSTGSVATVEYVSPDRYHITTSASQIVLTGNVEYAKRTGGQWMQTPNGGEHQALLQAIWQLAGPPNIDLHKLFKVTALGTRSFGASSLRGYRLIDTTGAYSETLWIGPDDLPVTARIEMPDQTVTIHYADYNGSTLIATPY